jgi:hypothetical protein
VPRFTGGETYVHHLSVKEFRRLLEDKVRARASILSRARASPAARRTCTTCP